MEQSDPTQWYLPTNQSTNQKNAQSARFLRSLADYIEIADADTDADISIGFRFKLLGDKYFQPTAPIEKVGVRMSSVAAQKLADFVKYVQNRTGEGHGEDIVKIMEQYRADLDKQGYLG